MDLEIEKSDNIVEAEQEVATDKIPAPSSRTDIASFDADTYMEREARAYVAAEAREKRDAESTVIGSLNAAIKTRRMIEVTVNSVVVRNNQCFWASYYDSVTILVPFDQTSTILPAELLGRTSDSILTRQRQFLAKSIGVTIPVVITSSEFDPNGGAYYYASRTQALGRIRRSFFRRGNIAVGSDVLAHVIAVSTYSLTVTACGTDIRIPNYNITTRYVADMEQVYKPGQRLMLRVTELELGEDGTPSVFRLSGRAVEVDRLRPNLERLQGIGDNPRFAGTVTSIRQNQDRTNVTVFLFLDGIELPAFSRSVKLSLRDELHIGDEVYFEVHGIHESGYVHGSIVRYKRSR